MVDLRLVEWTNFVIFLRTAVAHTCFARVIYAIRVLKTIQVMWFKANGDINAVVIESKYNNQLLKINIYRGAHFKLHLQLESCMFSNLDHEKGVFR
jgi:hypothetical protein